MVQIVRPSSCELWIMAFASCTCNGLPVCCKDYQERVLGAGAVNCHVVNFEFTGCMTQSLPQHPNPNPRNFETNDHDLHKIIRPVGRNFQRGVRSIRQGVWGHSVTLDRFRKLHLISGLSKSFICVSA